MRNEAIEADQVASARTGNEGGRARWRALVVVALQVFGTAAAFKLLDRVAAAFSEPSGASFIFPPAGLALAAGTGFGGWGVAGVFLGVLISPWGAATSWQGRLLFGAVNAVVAAVPALALRHPSGGTSDRLKRAILFGLLLNTLAGALAGVGALVAVGRLSPLLDPLADHLISWWTGDFMAALVLGFPLLLMVSPSTLLAGEDRELLSAWLRNLRQSGLCLAALAAAAGAIHGAHIVGWGFPEWLSVTLVAPIALAAAQGGLGPAILMNLLAATTYALLMVMPALTDGTGSWSGVLASAYSVLVFLASFGLIAGLFAGHNRRLLAQVRRQQQLLQRDFERAVASLSAAIEAKDPTTDGHVQRVARLAVTVGRRMGMSGRELELLRYGALLHDVGKIGVPEAILNKNGGLGEQEMEVMKRHVEIGLKIIGSFELLQEVMPIVRFHQERWDGRCEGVAYPGYFGLRAEEIPLGARILAAVDAFDAMTNDRPYRPARPPEEALSELRREAGQQFDPAVVEALVAEASLRRFSELTSGERWPLFPHSS